jgi:aminoacyl tRNA synthase complex-interacting multifunctional protein 1
MAAIALASEDKVLSLILNSFKDLAISRNTSATPISQLTLNNSDTVSGTNTIASYLSSLIPKFRNANYTDLEKAQIEQWLTLSNVSPIPGATLDTLNENLKFRTTILGEKISIADVVVYSRIKDIVAAWSDEQRTGGKGRRHVVRWVDFVQNSEDLGLQVSEEEKVKVNADKVLFHPKPEEAPKKEKKPAAAGAEGAVEEGKKKARAAVEESGQKVKEGAKEAAAAATGGKQGQKTEKKQKPKREPPPPKEGMRHLFPSPV